MYQLIPASWRISVLTAVGFLAICAVGAFEWFGVDLSAYRVASGVALALVGLVSLAFGSSKYNSPWRWLWRKVPSLNSLVFPDINGIWIGETHSNWPVIKAVLDAAANHSTIDTDSLENIPLQKDGMAIRIDATLYRVQIAARASNTGGESHSLITTLDRIPTMGKIRLAYLYEQQTPEPKGSDESAHLGAATLRFRSDDLDKCDGVYWTRRAWRQGMNTAGQLAFERFTDRVNPKEHDLLELAKNGPRGRTA